MKHIKSFEKLGVPENITETGEQIYNLIIKELKTLNPNVKLPDNDEIEITINDKFIISDYKFNTINAILTFNESNLDKVTIYSYGFNFQVEPTDNPKIMKFAGNYNKVNLIIEIGIPENETIKMSEFIDFLENDKIEVINSLTHEISHSYEKYKKPGESITNRANYETIKEMRMGIKEIDNFTHMLYFISETENNVRPSEVAADMKQQNITKAQFKDFIENNDVYQKLLKAKNFSYEQLKKNMIESIEDVNNFIENHRNIYNEIPTSDIEKVNLILQTYHSTVIRLKMKNIKSALKLDHPLAQLFLNDVEERADIYNKYGKKITKQKKYDKFFAFEEKRINFTANKMIKKIHKLYDMAKDEETPKTTKEIKDWELYHKIKKTPESEFTTEIKNYNIKKKNK